jgi:hypothetical protein
MKMVSQVQEGLIGGAGSVPSPYITGLHYIPSSTLAGVRKAIYSSLQSQSFQEIQERISEGVANVDAAIEVYMKIIWISR